MGQSSQSFSRHCENVKFKLAQHSWRNIVQTTLALQRDRVEEAANSQVPLFSRAVILDEQLDAYDASRATVCWHSVDDTACGGGTQFLIALALYWHSQKSTRGIVVGSQVQTCPKKVNDEICRCCCGCWCYSGAAQSEVAGIGSAPNHLYFSISFQRCRRDQGH